MPVTGRRFVERLLGEVTSVMYWRILLSVAAIATSLSHFNDAAGRQGLLFSVNDVIVCV